MTDPTVVNFSASSSLILMPNSFSSAMNVSITSRESSPRSLVKEAEGIIADCSNPSFSEKMVLTFAAIPDLSTIVFIINYFEVLLIITGKNSLARSIGVGVCKYKSYYSFFYIVQRMDGFVVIFTVECVSFTIN